MNRKVFDLEGAVHGHEDREANDDEELADEYVGKTDSCKVGEEGKDKAEAEGGDDGGNGMKLGLDGGVAEGFDDCGGKVGEGINGDDDRLRDSACVGVCGIRVR